MDFAGLLIYNDAEEVLINFGKYKGQVLRDVLQKDTGYYTWVMGAQFPLETKAWFTRIYQAGRSEDGSTKR